MVGRPPGARASRPQPYSCKQPLVPGHSLARRTKPAFTGFASLVPGLVRARIPPGARASRPHPYSCKQPPSHGHSLAKCTKPAFTGFSSLVPGFVRARIPPGARASRPQPCSCISLSSTATPSQSAPNPPLRGSLRLCQVLCGRDARAPGGGAFDRLHCLHRLIREGCQRNERCEKSLQCTSSAMEADGLFVHQQRSDASLIPGIHTNGKLCFCNESPTLTAYLGWSSPGSAGVPPASLFLQTASRPRPLPRQAHQTRLYGVRFSRARTCGGENPPGSAGVPPASLFLQTASQPRPLPRKVHQTRLYGVLFPRARLCAGETPAFPGGLVRAGRPRSRGGLLCRPHPKRGSRSRSWRSLGASRSLADRRGCRMGHSIPISGSSQRMAIWSSAS